MRRKQPEHTTAATQVPRNSGHPHVGGSVVSALAERMDGGSDRCANGQPGENVANEVLFGVHP